MLVRWKVFCSRSLQRYIGSCSLGIQWDVAFLGNYILASSSGLIHKGWQWYIDIKGWHKNLFCSSASGRVCPHQSFHQGFHQHLSKRWNLKSVPEIYVKYFCISAAAIVEIQNQHLNNLQNTFDFQPPHFYHLQDSSICDWTTTSKYHQTFFEAVVCFINEPHCFWLPTLVLQPAV